MMIGRSFSRSARRSVRVERDEVVAEHRADVRDPEVLEELARLRELDDGVAEATRPLEQRRARPPAPAATISS